MRFPGKERRYCMRNANSASTAYDIYEIHGNSVDRTLVTAPEFRMGGKGAAPIWFNGELFLFRSCADHRFPPDDRVGGNASIGRMKHIHTTLWNFDIASGNSPAETPSGVAKHAIIGDRVNRPRPIQLGVWVWGGGCGSHNQIRTRRYLSTKDTLGFRQ